MIIYLDQCRRIELSKIIHPLVNLTFVEENRHILFEIKRAFYIYDIPAAQNIRAHEHHRLQQFLVYLSGSFNANLDDCYQKKTIQLSRAWQDLCIHSTRGASKANFLHGRSCMVLAFIKQLTRYYDIFLKAIGDQA
jgi:hypothetical protein